jgi:hypothetical protein
VINSIETSLTHVPTGQGLESGPRLMVVPVGAGADTVELYRRFVNAPSTCRAGESLVAIVRSEVLNTPDQAAVRSSARRGNAFVIELELRRYDGPLAANDPWLALIRADLGALRQGRYRLVLRETVLRFMELHRPERASGGATREQRLGFECA